MSLKEFAKHRSRSLEGKKRRESSSASESLSTSDEKKRKKHQQVYEQDKHSKKHKKHVKHNRIKRKSSDSSERSSSSESEEFDKRKEKSKHKDKKRKERKKKKKDKKSKNSKVSKLKTKSYKETEDSKEMNSVKTQAESIEEDSMVQGPSLQDMQQQPKKRSMAPMTREEYEKQQSKIRRVVDPETGRHRLIKGDGEVIEEIVSYDRHKMINKMATRGDGLSFQAYLQKEKLYDPTSHEIE